MDNTEPIKILFVNTGVNPISFEKSEVDAANVKEYILNGINKLGKQSHALIKFKDRLFVCDHKARKGPSADYYRAEVKYHPFASELA